MLGWIAGLCVLQAPCVFADLLILKDRPDLSGDIIYEDEQIVRIKTGNGTIPIQRANIAEIHYGSGSVQSYKQRANQAMVQIEKAIGENRFGAALQLIDQATADLAEGLAKFDPTPPDLKALDERLAALRVRVMEVDPKGREAEALYRQARERLDRIDYKGAYPLLRKAAELTSDRTDILSDLASVANRQMNEPDVAIGAYRRLLDLDPETQYAEVATPLLTLVRRKGQRLLSERKADDAIEMVEQMLLLAGENESEPVSLATFLERRTQRQSQPEEERLMQVYRYADDRDLVDLALAAIGRVEQKNPDDPQVRQLARQTAYLSEYNELLTSGDRDAVTQFQEAADPELVSSREVQEKMRRIREKVDPNLESKRLLDQAQKAFDAAEYVKAEEVARRILTEYPKSPEAETALTLSNQAAFETPIHQELRAIEDLVGKRLHAEALKRTEAVLAKEETRNSRHLQGFQNLSARIPREMEALRLWQLAQADLDADRFQQALDRLGELTRQYPDTDPGRQAGAWLNEYQRSLSRKVAEESHMAEDMTDWFFKPLAAALSAVPIREGGVTPDAPGGAGRLAAWDAYDRIAQREASFFADPRSRAIHWGAPAGFGAFLLLAGLLRYGRPGRGTLPSAAEDPTPAAGICRICGLPDGRSGKECAHCGAPVAGSDVENQRKEDKQRSANFDPWEFRVRADQANDFERYYQIARDCVEKGDWPRAIQACRRALQEDPHNTRGYEMLADLYERTGDAAKAYIAYREIVLLDPENANVRLKLEATGPALQNAPLKIRGTIAAMSIALWWLLFWASMGITTQGWKWRILAATLGCLSTVLIWWRVQASRRRTITPPNTASPGLYLPLPEGTLKWGEQNRQASLLAGKIKEHVGCDVPILGVGRLHLILALSLTLLGGLLALSWLNHYPWAVLAWPGGLVLLVYLLEVHPRAVTGLILLRHFYEETWSPWSDPHRPFIPKAAGDGVKGDFLIDGPEEFPLGWAVRPLPYRADRQGLLNSIQQTLNRHWDCHRFYDRMRATEDYESPMPVGFGIMTGLSILCVALTLGGAGYVVHDQMQHRREFEDMMKLGYHNLLAGDAEQARTHFEQATDLKPERAVPQLYLAHTHMALGRQPQAEAAFNSAREKNVALSAIHNDYGNFLQREGRLAEAVKAYERAAEIDSENADILNNMGSAYYKLRQLDPAGNALRRAIGLDAEHPRAHTTLGLVYEALGQPEAARAEFRKAIEIAPNHPYTDVSRNRLEGNEAVAPLELKPAADDADSNGS
jgi:tetratricopeptide (TPR) repeat protein